VFVQIRVAHNFAANELVLKVGVDDACRLRRLRTLADGPRTHFIRAAGEVPDQLECPGSNVRLRCVCDLRGVKEGLRRDKCILRA
jgi:hypothetical protein